MTRLKTLITVLQDIRPDRELLILMIMCSVLTGGGLGVLFGFFVWTMTNFNTLQAVLSGLLATGICSLGLLAAFWFVFLAAWAAGYMTRVSDADIRGAQLARFLRLSLN